jgi:energy-coupling factor transporter transmembrane protein EcfT
MNGQQNEIHPLVLLIISLVFILLTLVHLSPYQAAQFSFPLIVLLFWNGLSFINFIFYFVICLFMSLGIFLLNLFHPDLSLVKDLPMIHFGGFIFSQNIIEQAFYFFFRMVVISTISLCAGSIIDYSQVILYLMQRYRFPVKVGYSMIIALNSVSHLKKEYERIMINFKLRRISKIKQVYFLVPLIIFAFRYADRSALSLVTRNINQDKTYFQDYYLMKKDIVVLMFFLIYFFALIILI